MCAIGAVAAGSHSLVQGDALAPQNDLDDGGRRFDVDLLFHEPAWDAAGPPIDLDVMVEIDNRLAPPCTSRLALPLFL